MCLFVGIGNVSAGNVVLKAGSAWPQTGEQNPVFLKFFDLVEQKTNGTVKIEWSGGPELFKARDLPTAAAAGSIDIYHTAPGYLGGTVPEAAIFDAYPAYRNYDNAPMIYKDVLKILAPLLAEKLKCKPLGLHTVFPFYIWTMKPIRSIEELKGMKIRVHGGLAPFIAKELGVTPVTMPSGDVYMAMERGVVDGAVRNQSAVNTFKEFEFVKHCIYVPITWGTSFGSITLRIWDKLDEKQKQGIMAASEEITEVCTKFYKERDEELTSLFKSKGVEFFEPSPKFKSEWEKLIVEGGNKGAFKLSPDRAQEIINIFKKHGS